MSELAKYVESKGFKVFDIALPQPWLDDVVRKTGCDYDIARVGFVWRYDPPHKIFGCPAPITNEAADILRQYDALTGSHYAEATFESR